MGLDAVVRCRCLEDGLAAPPPFAVELDEEGWLTRVDRDDDAAWEQFHRWLAKACRHPEMEYATEHISNWGGYRGFQDALRRLGGAGSFPVLTDELPEANGGQTSAGAAAAALRELERFLGEDASWSHPVLVDQEGELLATRVDAYDGVFSFSPDGNLALTDEGTLVVLRDDAVVFASVDFEQVAAADGSTTFRDVATGVCIDRVPSVESWSADAEGPGPMPARLHVELQRESARDYAWIVERLERIFRASVETGNPVQWT
jgi:hypothetical protein